MNKRIFGGLFSVGLISAALLFHSQMIVYAAAVTLTWAYDYSVDPGCTAVPAKNCVTGFEYGTTPDGGATLNKLGTVPNPTPVPTTLTSGITASFKQGPPYGSVVYYVRATGVDANANPVFSAPALAQPVGVNPGQPQNVAVSSIK